MTESTVALTGLHIVDILGYPVSGIPEGQGIAFLDEIRMTPAGTCAATAMDLAKIGVPAAVFGLVGEDDMGRWLRGRLREYGVTVGNLLTTGDAPTSATMLPIRPNGERPALHARGANALLGEQHFDWEALAGMRHLHIGGTTLLPLLDGEPTARVLQRAHELGLTTSIDIIFDPSADYEAILGPCYPYLDYFLPNDEDAMAISGRPDPAAAASWFLERGVGAVAVTLGPDGALFASTAETFTVPAPTVDVVDTSGCGDAFSAGFIAGLVEGRGARAAVSMGVGCGSLVATGLGSDAGLRDRPGLLDFMRGAGLDAGAPAA